MPDGSAMEEVMSVGGRFWDMEFRSSWLGALKMDVIRRARGRAATARSTKRKAA